VPELPDVEIYKRYLDEHALGETVSRVRVQDPRILDRLSPDAFRRRLEGRRLKGSRRHGKHLLVELDRGGWLTLHFGMTGDLVAFENEADDPPYDRVRFDFASGRRLAYVNRRMLGRVGCAEDADAFIEEHELGPDALALDLRAFKAALGGRRRDVKSALMDQATIAGIGNIYADEILYQARLHPRTPLADLGDEEVKRLHREMGRVLAMSIERGAGSERFTERLPEGWLLPHREKGARCPRCGGSIETLKAGGRTTYFCPRCQPKPGG
jgi:formamidopyrimidine-DNA glycosylase